MLELILAVNFFGKKLPTSPPFKAPVLSDLYFQKKECDAVKKLFSILQSASNQVLVTATNVLTGVVCKKLENPSNLFFRLCQLIRKNNGEWLDSLFFNVKETDWSN